MKGDFSRSTFNPGKHYSGVRMQQGRVQLDADWNENLDILRRRIETETIDVIGQCGVPVHDAAFGVVTDFNTLSQMEQDWLTAQGFSSLGNGDFYLTGGRAYVDGLLVESDHTLPFSQQPFVLPKGQKKLDDPGIYLLYLDVWERHITALEDPSIREVALGGPDTATRSQVIWQAVAAKVSEVGGETVTCADDLTPWPAASKGRLRARTHPEDQPDDVCAVPSGAGYKRLENQLYRVEIHKGSDMAGGPTFKWSRDNGSIVVSVKEFPIKGDYSKVRTSSLGRDDVLGLHENDWVEVLDDAAELAGLPGVLVQIDKIEPDNILTLSSDLPNTFAVLDADGAPTHLKVRRWDSDGEQTVTVPGTNDGYLKLEGGVEIKFEIDTYHTGDYWLIPARTVPGQYGDIEWPQDGGDQAALLPFGIIHHYCKLAVLTVQNTAGALEIDVEDCRPKFPPLTELPVGGDHCCSVTVGQGGDYPDLQSAVDARPADADWWTICILPGLLSLKDTIAVDGAKNLTIGGCGPQCQLFGPLGKPVFTFTNTQDVKLEGLRIGATSPGGAILFGDSSSIVMANCYAYNGNQASGLNADTFAAVGPLIMIDNGEQVEIRDNDLLGLPAVQANGRVINILHNRITGGGIQIIPPSQGVEIDDNFIFKGTGPGIRLGGGDKTAQDFVTMYGYAEDTLNQPGGNTSDAVGVGAGSAPPAPSAGNYLAGIRLVTISCNLIGMMTGSGIITETSLAEVGKLGDVEDMSVRDNQIVKCCKVPDVSLGDKTGVGGGLAAIGLFSTQITGNFIAENGLARQAACGIFVLDGSDLDISGNVVVENGSGEDQPKPDFYQAGIAAQFVFGNFLNSYPDKGTTSSRSGYPALRINDNQVICPAGQALTVTSMGSVMVEGNTFATRERKQQPASPLNFGEKGACVSLLDLGLPVWLPDFALLLQMLSTKQTNLHVQDFQQADAFFARFPDGRLLFHDNQVTFNTDREEEVASLGKLDNQWAQRAWDAATLSALFVSLDDISLSGNQFQATVPLYALEGLQKYQSGNLPVEDLLAYLLKFIQVGSVGSTVRATGNGLSERIGSNGVSYASNAVAMNITTSNEATHALLTNAPKKAEANNLSLF